jgi:hypothetical protein
MVRPSTPRLFVVKEVRVSAPLHGSPILATSHPPTQPHLQFSPRRTAIHRTVKQGASAKAHNAGRLTQRRLLLIGPKQLVERRPQAHSHIERVPAKWHRRHRPLNEPDWNTPLPRAPPGALQETTRKIQPRHIVTCTPQRQRHPPVATGLRLTS